MWCLSSPPPLGGSRAMRGAAPCSAETSETRKGTKPGGGETVPGEPPHPSPSRFACGAKRREKLLRFRCDRPGAEGGMAGVRERCCRNGTPREGTARPGKRGHLSPCGSGKRNGGNARPLAPLLPAPEATSELAGARGHGPRHPQLSGRALARLRPPLPQPGFGLPKKGAGGAGPGTAGIRTQDLLFTRQAL